MNIELRMGEQTRGAPLDFDVGRERVKEVDAEREPGLALLKHSISHSGVSKLIPDSSGNIKTPVGR